VQRFHRVWEMGELAKKLKAEIVTEKLDGVMVCGVVVEGEVELWTRGGRTAQAQAAMRVAREQAGMLEMLSEVWEQGGSPTFEYIGRESMVKVRYGDAELVLVAVRDRQTGGWWDYERLECLCDGFGVQLVNRHMDLVGLTLKDVQKRVVKRQGEGGVVVWLNGGHVCKVKTRWWLKREVKGRRRWCNAEVLRQRDTRRHLKKQERMETKGQRVVLRGWDKGVSPAVALQVYPKAVKVEALYRRGDGKQGTVVLGFRSEQEAQAVRGGYRVRDMTVWAEQAYSARCRSDQHRWVRTWWRQARGQSERGCEEESGCEGQSECEVESECEGVGEDEWGDEEWEEMNRCEKEQWELEAEQEYEKARP